jgi:tetratricopeptide (TPR) repeat protein
LAEWLQAHVYYREAKALIDGREAAEQALARLAQRAHEQRQDAQAQAAARRHEALAKAEAAWQRAIDLAGDDPLPWIQRGRWYAERGEHAKADADFAQAASLTPGELNKFLEAGWWVVGPYPEALKEFCPPELDPDPSQPVYTIDPETGLSEQPVAWRSVAPEGYGLMVQPGHAALDNNQEHVSVYAVTYVYSPDERTETLFVGGDDSMRVWLNGRLVHETTQLLNFDWSLDRVAVTLRPGRNTLLVKVNNVTESYYFRLRLADGPIDRAFALAEMGLWDEAAEQMRRANLHGMRDPWFSARYAELLLASGDVEGYRRHCERMLQQFTNSASSWEACNLAWACSLAPDVAPDAERLVRIAELGLDPSPAERYRIGVLVRALYRAGRFDEAIKRLGELADLPNPTKDLILAMAHHGRGDTDKARQLLDNAQNWYDAATRAALAAPTYKRPHWHWKELATFQVQYREARALIDGTTVVEDQNAADLIARAREELARRDPLTADFDQALMVEPEQARHWLARGKRLAELGRFDEAEADFNKAMELSPDDADVFAARAVFFADRGEVDKAAADFHAALNAFSYDAKPRWAWGLPIDYEVAHRPEVFARLAALRPEDGRLLIARLVLRIQQGDIDGAQSDAESLTPHGADQLQAAHALWRGDVQEFDRLRAAAAHPHPHFQTVLLGLAPTEEPMTSKLLDAAEQMWRERTHDHWNRRWLGLAQLRAGKLPEAVASLEASLAPGTSWANDGVVWPMLAIAQHHSGNAELARQWLDKTAIWLQWRTQLESRRVGGAPADIEVGPETWLYALVFYLEATALIDGPDAATEARDRLAAQAQEWNLAARAKADARRQDARHSPPAPD